MSFKNISYYPTYIQPIIKENNEENIRHAITNKLSFINTKDTEIKDKVNNYLYLVR